MSAVSNLVPFQWKPGQSGNPGGRQKGRKQLEEAFLRDLVASWDESGVDAIKRVIAKQPAKYLQIVASLMPKKLDAEGGLDGISRADLRTAIDVLRSVLTAGANGGIGSGASESGPTNGLPSLPETG